APRGLRPGSLGFCTVASTAGMSTPLAELLESLSGYREVFAPHDPKSALNPVAWSHLRATVGDREWSILSRVAFAGLDYSGRTNKFAHHVALDPPERPPGGPAWLMMRPGFLEGSWDGR